MAHETLLPDSFLDAVNILLDSIGEPATNQIDEVKRLDVAKAVLVLNEVNTEVQQEGWWFNEDFEFVISPTIPEGYLNIPVNTLDIEVVSGSPTGLVERNGRLYDPQEQTDAGFTAPVTVRIVRYLDFADLPYAARRYVTMRAIPTYQVRTLGDENLTRFQNQEMQAARNALLRREHKHRNHNSAHSGVMRELLLNR